MAYRFVNWARTVTVTPRSFHQPRSEAEVATIVRESAGRRVRVVGAGHSWSDVAACDDVMLNLDALDAVVVTPNSRDVRVGAGIRLRELNRRLQDAGLALPILGSVTEQSFAGAMSTGTHGSSLVHGNLAAIVVGARVVVASGDVLDLREGDERLLAVRAGLGAIGVVTEVTLRCVPAFRLREEIVSLPFDEAADTIEAIARSGEFVKVWWMPHTDRLQIFRCERTDLPGEPSPVATWLDEAVVNRWVFAGLLGLGARAPAVVPPLNRLIASVYFRPRTRIGTSWRILPLAMPPRHRETEYAVPIERAGEALRRLRAIVAREGLRVNFIAEARFGPPDDAWLSMTHGRASCLLGAYMAESPGVDRYFSCFEAEMRELGGRPHWGKEFDPAGALATYPMADRFVALVDELDPEGRFRNPRLDAILGPGSGSGTGSGSAATQPADERPPRTDAAGG